MSGFYGYIKNSTNQKQHELSGYMKNALIENPKFKASVLIDDKNLKIEVLDSEDEAFSSFVDTDVCVYVCGEIYSHKNVADKIYKAYKNQKLNTFLAQIDGHYNCIIYNKQKNIILFITDRYGLNPIFVYQKNDDFIFAPRPKGMLGLEFVDKSISETAFETFCSYGHFLGNDTWCKYINLLPPATIYEYNFISKGEKKEYYFSWKNIKRNDISFDEAYRRLGELFITAVDKRFDDNEITINLSGGRDSRLILSAICHLYPSIQGKALTFGSYDCDDVIIAREVAKRANLTHRVYEFDKQDWFFSRFEDVIKSDGLYSLMHMHRVDFEDLQKYSLNGFGGDYIFGNEVTQYRYLLKEQVLNTPYKDHKQVGFLDKEYLGEDDIIPYLIINGGRRFNYSALMQAWQFTQVRLPFMDNDVLEFIYSLPLDYRLDGKIYAKVALEFFPKFYKDIPWQRTRKTLDGLTTSILPQTPTNKSYLNYAGAIREKSILKFLYETLEYKNSLYQNYTDIDAVSSYLQPHIDDIQQNHIAKILNFLTAEIYLRELHK